MAALKKYDITGKEVGEVSIDDDFFDIEANGQMIKDYLVALRANARQWSANTKVRSEVSHSNHKPHKQKGTGMARQGSLAAPQFKGGGIVFGPKPKFDQVVRVNKKEKRKAIRYLIGEKIRQNSLFVLEDKAMIEGLETPRTKQVVSFLKAMNLYGRKVLFLAEESPQSENESFENYKPHDNFIRSMRNIPSTKYKKSMLANGYDLANAYYLVVSESALNELRKILDT